MGKNLGIHRLLGSGRATVRVTKDGRMAYLKGTGHVTKPSAHQIKLGKIGKLCGAEIRGKYTGSSQTAARRKAMGDCVKAKW